MAMPSERPLKWCLWAGDGYGQSFGALIMFVSLQVHLDPSTSIVARDCAALA